MTTVDRFMKMFRGLDRAYGTYVIQEERDADGKKIGQAHTKREPVTRELWENHLSGKMGIGIVPILDGDLVVFGAIDIDSYHDLNLSAIAEKLSKENLPLAVCRSKSGGAHVYCFVKSPVPAKDMQRSLREIAGFIGFGGSEIFPKQSKILSAQGDIGSWINMPYFNGLKGLRYCIKPDGDALSPEDFLDLAEAMAVDPEWFERRHVDVKPLPEGPPCLQILIQDGFPRGMRNKGLFNMAIYARMSNPDGWSAVVDRYNHDHMLPPLSTEEVRTIKSSVNRNPKYTYTCSQEPICSRCNAVLCRTRKFGISFGNDSQMPLIGGLTKLDTKPPLWFLEVNGTRIELSTSQLQDTKQFQGRCMETINHMPPIVSRNAWQRIIQGAMEGLAIIEAPKEMSLEGQFFQALEKFCTGPGRATSMEDIILGRPYTDEMKTYFRAIDLLSFLTRIKFPLTTLNKITAMLREIGADHGAKNIRGRHVNFWTIKKFDAYSEESQTPSELNQEDIV